mmetsp:Transcript_26738/g.58705  ORF Transcript_26738/g.58705 Transcript_26738/m.58705 type:complete len:296 (+) Transcript_26738:302-1189(+)
MSARPCVTSTRRPRCALRREAHCSTTMGAPLRKATPATCSSFVWFSAVSSAVIAPCEKPPSRTRFEGSGVPAPPASSRVSRSSVESCARHLSRPRGSSRIACATVFSSAVESAMNFIASSVHHAAPIIGSCGACGKTSTADFFAKACRSSISPTSVRSRLVAPSPCSMMMAKSALLLPLRTSAGADTRHSYPPNLRVTKAEDACDELPPCGVACLATLAARRRSASRARSLKSLLSKQSAYVSPAFSIKDLRSFMESESTSDIVHRSESAAAGKKRNVYATFRAAFLELRRKRSG